MRREAIIKTRIILMSIIFMLLALPAEARVYAAVVSRGVLTGEGVTGSVTNIPGLEGLKTILDVNDQGITTLFQNGDFALPVDRELIIMGPRTAVKNELALYPQRYVTTTDPRITACGCYHPQKGYAYVEIRSATFGVGQCPDPLKAIFQHDLKKVNLLQVANSVKALKYSRTH